MLAIYVIIFWFGMCVGSFINVLADRLSIGENPFKGRSRCDFCKKTLSPFDLIPVLSFIFLGGKCRYCHKKLSIQYPVIEFISGVMFVLLYLYTSQIPSTKFQAPNPNLIVFNLSLITYYLSLIIIFSSFLVIFISDFKKQIIPDEMLIALLFGSVVYLITEMIKEDSFAALRMTGNGIAMTGTPLVEDCFASLAMTITPHLLSAIGAGIFFLAIYLLTKGRGMGFGDVKLVPLLGLWLGYPKILIAIYLAFLTGALISIILIILKKKGLKSQIAFGPFLLIGTLISFFYGGIIWQNFTHLLF